MLDELRVNCQEGNRALKKQSCDALSAAMDGTNCCEIMRTTHELGCTVLQKASLNHVISNFDAACASPGFVQL